jgi:hypothetical protein
MTNIQGGVMPAKLRDSSKASSETNLPARKALKRQRDKASRVDFGFLDARPSSPRKRTAAKPGQLADSGVTDDIDLPSQFSTTGTKPR